MTYQDVVEILKVSLDQAPARHDRFEAFRRAVSFHTSGHQSGVGITLPVSGRGVFLVGGTNGKGTVSKTLETLLQASGARVGLFTSPHLIEPTERIRSGGADLTPDEMLLAYTLIEDVVHRFDLSHFEILTLMMIEVFFGRRVRSPVDLAVIEVGVGGRLDPTRAIPHETAVLARIGLDHEAILGSTLVEIATEKLAIAEGARRLIYLKPEASLTETFISAQNQFRPCEFIESREFPSEISPSEHPEWKIETPWGHSKLALMGERAVQNTSLALEVLAMTGVDVSRVLPALTTVEWPGRMEKLEFQGRAVYVSGDHNEQGVTSLVEILSHFKYETIWLVVGVGKGKPIEAMLRHYLKIPRAKLILTRTTFRPVELSVFEPFVTKVFAVVDDALSALKLAVSNAAPGDLVVASGSLYLVGDLIAKMSSKKTAYKANILS